MTQNSLAPFARFVVTSRDSELLMQEMRGLQDTLFQKEAEGAWDAYVEMNVRVGVAEALRSAAPGAAERKAWLSSLISELSDLPRIHLTTAIEPTRSALLRWHQRLSQATQTFPLLELKVDQTLIGGAQISWGGMVHDGSLRKALREEMAT